MNYQGAESMGRPSTTPVVRNGTSSSCFEMLGCFFPKKHPIQAFASVLLWDHSPSLSVFHFALTSLDLRLCMRSHCKPLPSFFYIHLLSPANLPKLTVYWLLLCKIFSTADTLAIAIRCVHVSLVFLS